MVSHTRPVAVALAGLALLIGGCRSASGPEEPTPTATGQDATSADATADPVATRPSGSLDLTGWQQTHPGATSVALHAIEVDETGHLLLDVEVVTGRDGIYLMRWDTFLIDDLDNRHDLIPPDDNPEVEVPADSRLRATFAFDEPIADDATHVTFAINSVANEIIDAEDDTNPLSSGPALAFRDIPLPGLGLDHEADRGESTDLVEAASLDVDISQTHPDGVVVTVTRIASDARSVRLDIEVDNPTEREVSLLAGNPHLYDGPRESSSVGAYQRAEVDDQEVRRLDIPAGGEASATMAFRGTINPDATSLTLTLNGGSNDATDTVVPAFTIGDLPVPGREGGSTQSPSASPSPSD